MKRIGFGAIAGVVACILLNAPYLVSRAQGQMMIKAFPGRQQAGAGGVVNFPYQQSDNSGNTWMIYGGGMMREVGPQQIYGQGGMITVNGNGPGGNQGRIDPKTGELIMENVPCGPVSLTRRILISKDEGYIRYIDILKNEQAQELTANVVLSTNLNYGVNNAATVDDPKHKDHQIGWVAMTGINRAAVEMFAGKGAKTTPSISAQNGNNVVQASITLTIPAGKSVALMHVHTTANTVDAGQQFILNSKESKLVQNVPLEIRRLLVNFGGGENFIGNYEILRGDLFDVVELRTGDQIKGTIKEDSYKLNTFYGKVELPRDQVIAMINVGKFRPRQLIVTSDGQVFGGQIDQQTISMELSSGQTTQIPVSQINRLGYRKRAGEPEQWTFDKPCVLMRTGDRVNVEMPTEPIEVSTRYGLLKLDPKTITMIEFQSVDNSVHEICLTDGSRFAGLVNAPEFEMKLASPIATQPVKFPASSILRLQLASKADDVDDFTPTLSMANDDVLVGSLVGDLKLNTAFDTLQLKAPEIRRIVHASQESSDVQVTLWDNTVVSGQLQEQVVQCKLASGTTIDVPLALVEEYNQPMPEPSATMVEQIKAKAVDLSAEDWKVRDQAEMDLVKMGPAVMSVLKQMRATAPPEAQQRIESILKQLAKKGMIPAASPGTAPDMPGDDVP